jgi:hypothetical protein
MVLDIMIQIGTGDGTGSQIMCSEEHFGILLHFLKIDP